MRLAIVLAVLCCCKPLYAQQSTRVTGQLMEKANKLSISNAKISLENTLKEFSTDSDGKFEFDLPGRETETLHVSALDFIPKRFSLHLDGNPIDLGVIYLERDIAHEQTDNLISLTDDDFTEDFVFT